MSRPGHGRARFRARGHRARPRASRCAGVGCRHRGGGTRRAPRRRRGPGHLRVLRQPSAQREHGRRSRAGVCASSRPDARRVDRGQRRVPGHHGRPHRPGHDRRRHRGGGAPARRRRCSPGDRGAVRPVGDRGSLPRRASRVGERRRAIRQRRGALRAHEAAAPERKPLHARLPRLPDAPRLRVAGLVRPAARAFRAAADAGRDRAHACEACRHRPRAPIAASS